MQIDQTSEHEEKIFICSAFRKRTSNSDDATQFRHTLQKLVQLHRTIAEVLPENT